MKRWIVAASAMFLPVMAGSGDHLFSISHARGPWDSATAVAAGFARIDDALDRLVPMRYRIVIDRSIPEQAILSWPRSDDWVTAVRLGLDAIGLELRFREQDEVVEIRHADRRIRVGRIERVDLQQSKWMTFVSRTPLQPEIVVERNVIPGNDILNSMRLTVAQGGKVFLKGYSGTISEKLRVHWANIFAENMRKRLVAHGFPAKSLVVDRRTEYKTAKDKPGVGITLYGEVDEK